MTEVIKSILKHKPEGYNASTGIYASNVVFSGDWKSELENLEFYKPEVQMKEVELVDAEKGKSMHIKTVLSVQKMEKQVRMIKQAIFGQKKIQLIIPKLKRMHKVHSWLQFAIGSSVKKDVFVSSNSKLAIQCNYTQILTINVVTS